MKNLKLYLSITLGFLASVIVAVGIFITTIDLNNYKGSIEKAINEQSLVQVHIKGAIQYHIFPHIAVTLENVAIQMPKDKAKKENTFIHLSEASLSLDLKPFIAALYHLWTTKELTYIGHLKANATLSGILPNAKQPITIEVQKKGQQGIIHLAAKANDQDKDLIHIDGHLVIPDIQKSLENPIQIQPSILKYQGLSITLKGSYAIPTNRLKLSIEKIAHKNLFPEITNVQLDGIMQPDIKINKLNGKIAKGSFDIQCQYQLNTHHVDCHFDLKEIAIIDFLPKESESRQLIKNGQLYLKGHLHSKGQEADILKKNLNGTCHVDMKNMIFYIVDIKNLIDKINHLRTIQDLLPLYNGLDEKKDYKMDRAHGIFHVANGVLKTNDFKVEAPDLYVHLKMSADLITDGLKGQAIAHLITHKKIPDAYFTLGGTIFQPNVSFDIQKLHQDIIHMGVNQVKEKIQAVEKEVVHNLKQQAGSLLGSFLEKVQKKR